MGIKDILAGFLKRGIRIGYSTGPAFDPSWQERTDAMDDITKKKGERDGNGKRTQ